MNGPGEVSESGIAYMELLGIDQLPEKGDDSSSHVEGIIDKRVLISGDTAPRLDCRAA